MYPQGYSEHAIRYSWPRGKEHAQGRRAAIAGVEIAA
jgi:hypothetical protein